MSNPLEAFGSSIDLDASKVVNFPSLVFLCGGVIAQNGGIQSSLRGLFYDRLILEHAELKERVLLAEEANRWSKTAKHYDHLIDLEDDLAYLSAAILLFVESPGSIAELGAFCHVSALKEKLIAVLEHSYQNDNSFIQDGPVASLRKSSSRSVLFYPWLGKANECGIREIDPIRAKDTVNQLLLRLLDVISGVANEERFSRKNRGHEILIVADFIKLGVIVKRNEIACLLSGVGLQHVHGRLDRFLFLLEKLRFIKKTSYGHNTYYLSPDSPSEYIRYGFKRKGRASDRMRLRSDLTDVLKPLDRDRVRAFESYSAGSDGSLG